jgi:8-oxo-dGTP pyrophosphatase MutT (NUDIX family)
VVTAARCAAPFDAVLRERVSGNLSRFKRRPAHEPGLRHAAVALTLVGGRGGAACFVVTRRAARLPRHAGQFALPGGRLDRGEDAATAALRELREEIGLTLSPVDVLGLLDDFITRSGFVITPVVMWGPPRPRFTPDPDEVARVFRVPLAQLDREDIPFLTPIPQSDRPVLSLPLAGTEIFAPTAALIFQMREVALLGRDTRVVHYEQPVWAWR